MLKICLVFWKSEPQYAYKRYAYKRKNMYWTPGLPIRPHLYNSETACYFF